MPCGNGGCGGGSGGSLSVQGGNGGAGGSGNAPLPVAGFLVGGDLSPRGAGFGPPLQMASVGTGTANECAICGNGYAGTIPAAGQNPAYGPSTYVCNQGGNPRCIAGDSRVSMWGGGTKLASEIQEGDMIAGFNKNFVPVPQRVQNVLSSTQRCLRVDFTNGSCTSTAYHQMYQPDGSYVQVVNMMAGISKVVAWDGSNLDVLGIYDAGLVDVFAWECPQDHNFLSQGVIHHNKLLA